MALVGFFVLLLLLWPKAPAPEPYEVQQARARATVAELDRQARSAEFWSSFIQAAALISLCVLVLIVLAVLFWFLAASAHRQRLDNLNARKNYNLVSADPNGNYPIWLNRGAGEVVRTKPGNPPYPDPPAQFIVGNSPAAKLTDGKSRDQIPILYTDWTAPRQPAQSSYNYSVKVKEVKPGQLNEPDPNLVLNLEPGNEAGEPFEPGSGSEPEPNIRELFLEAKRRGEAASTAVPRITGCARNGKEPWLSYKKYYDKLEV
jgi:hypothetical protein